MKGLSDMSKIVAKARFMLKIREFLVCMHGITARKSRTIKISFLPRSVLTKSRMVYKQWIPKLHGQELAAPGVPLSQAEYTYHQQ